MKSVAQLTKVGTTGPNANGRIEFITEPNANGGIELTTGPKAKGRIEITTGPKAHGRVQSAYNHEYDSPLPPVGPLTSLDPKIIKNLIPAGVLPLPDKKS